ncbi:putative bifunctional diguanylate cyclase/phosphodiesterase [Amycolatopsis nigrescens]|uniref:putative bifunctional diguanylate cyclase/phosphodiesterase n=1 Tax=Amycolatopsis nigrescens TaxID=381445 RepID=UPI00047573C2|nr:EAL domain-containing protein [Amycolatopsis nigrescens]
MSEASQQPASTPAPRDEARARSVLARKWAYKLLSTVSLPLEQNELERELLAMVDAVCESVRSEPFSTTPAAEAGARLVELGCTADEALPCTVDVLGRGLLSRKEFQPTERFAERIVLGVGALAGGFAAANRRATFEQQDGMRLSLLKAIRDAQWNLKESEARFDEVTTCSASGIMITGLDGKLERANTAVEGILGHSPAELTGTSLFDLVHPDAAPMLRDDYQKLLDGTKLRIKQSQRLLRKDGDLARVSLTVSLLRNAEDVPSHFVTVVEDGTELMLLQSELNRQALHDVLTGLPNRQFFSTHLEVALRRADPEYGITLFQLELDAFAMICNGLGRTVGDQLLVHVGRRLQALLAAEKSMVARIDGDEFAIVVENSASTPSIAATVANINRELAEPIYSGGTGVAAQASIGVVHRPSTGLDPAELLRASDLTLRRATAAGRGQWELFDPDHDGRDRRTYGLAAAMPGAWENGEIKVVYRPVAKLAGGRVTGAEALLQWDHPDLGQLAHERCAELAEQTGLILSLGEWLLRTAGKQAGWWRQWLRHGPALVVGLTPHQVADADLISRVIRVLSDTNLPPERLTVGMPVRTVPAAQATDNLKVLADIGVRTTLDGFGTSPGELALLEDLPVRSVRLDRDLVERGSRSAPDSPVAKALLTLPRLVHQAGATVLVDGVHTREQAAWWRRTGADSAMGEFYGTACAPAELPAHFDPS